LSPRALLKVFIVDNLFISRVIAKIEIESSFLNIRNSSDELTMERAKIEIESQFLNIRNSSEELTMRYFPDDVFKHILSFVPYKSHPCADILKNWFKKQFTGSHLEYMGKDITLFPFLRALDFQYKDYKSYEDEDLVYDEWTEILNGLMPSPIYMEFKELEYVYQEEFGESIYDWQLDSDCKFLDEHL